MVKKEVSLLKPEHRYRLSQWEVCVYGPQNEKKGRLLCESIFNLVKGQTLILKMVRREVFLMKTKNQNHWSQQGECVYSAQSWEEKRLLSESMFISNERRNIILKMVEKKVFPVKPKHKYHLSQWGECVYGA